MIKNFRDKDTERIWNGEPSERLSAELFEATRHQSISPCKGSPCTTSKINEIVHGIRSVTADTPLRSFRYIGTTDRLWLNVQA